MKALSAQKGERIKVRVVKLTYRSQQQTPGGAALRSYIATDEAGREHLWHSSHLFRQPYGAKPYVCDAGHGDLYLTGTVSHVWGPYEGERGYYLLRGRFTRSDEQTTDVPVVAEWEGYK